ncbi:MAG: ATP-binding protein [Bacteroidetes bacterium]|nr:ATP-binding protein [Bacteroidota bacterium]
MSFTPWRDIAVPHQDVLKGTFQQSEFAADISRVHQGEAGEEYQNGKKFFSRTYITEGMALLLDAVVRRLAGKNGDPVIQLQTAFGGGKTHTLLAVYHLARGEYPTSELQGIPTILDTAGVQDLPKARVAVIDGINMSASTARKHGKISCRTIWGEIAMQLGGEEGYELVRDADEAGTSPSKDTMIALLRKASPCVLLLDELVAFYRQFEEGKSYSAGTHESNMTFFQTLTEAVKSVDRAILLASLPDSNDAGSGRGQVVLAELAQIFRRLQKIWKPVTKDEAFHIVRRRLFDRITDEAAMEDTCRSFAKFYIDNQADLPPDTQESRYLRRMLEAFPIHPELFDRLYEDWSTLPNFQRTRGVLQLMALVIHRLWKDGNADPLIMPGNLPLTDTGVRNKCIDHLPQGWDPVIDQDIDGEHSRPAYIESRDARFGQVQAARRVTRTIFLGSAPGTRSNRKGLELPDLLLGVAQPDQSLGLYKDVLKRLVDQCNYINVEQNSYWFGTKPNLRREMESRKKRFTDADDVFPLLQQRLGKLMNKKGFFAGVHIFTPGGDVPDEAAAPRLVVLTPQYPYTRTASEVAENAAHDILTKRGAQPRQYQNRLIFLAPDYDSLGRCREQARSYLAWTSILDDITGDHLVVDTVQIKQAKAFHKDAEQTLMRLVQDTWRWLLCPLQEKKKNGFDLHWEALGISTSAPDMPAEIQHRLREEEWVITDWAPMHLKNHLDAWYFGKGATDVPLQQVWYDMCSYLYMPRLAHSAVLTDTVSRAIESEDYLGYADSKESDTYHGFAFGRQKSVAIDPEAVLISRDAATEYLARLEQQAPDTGKPAQGESPAEGESTKPLHPLTSSPLHDSSAEAKSTVPTPTRFYGTVRINPITAKTEFNDIIDEVVRHFTTKHGIDVTITVEIQAKDPRGFDESTQRTVKENCGQLGFGVGDWEE